MELPKEKKAHNRRSAGSANSYRIDWVILTYKVLSLLISSARNTAQMCSEELTLGLNFSL